MKNFDIKLIKQSAKYILSKNRKTVTLMALVALGISLLVEIVSRVLGYQGGLSLIAMLMSIFLLAPAQIGQLNAYYKMSHDEKFELSDFADWYKNPEKLIDSLKTQGYYFGNLAIWFTIYVLFPMGVCYLIWNKDLISQDGFLNLGIAAFLFTGIILVAALPYFIHMLKYSGGLFYAGQESHMKIGMRFEIGYDFIKPHAYRYAVLVVSLVPYFVIGFAPIILAMIYAQQLGIFAYALGIAGYAFLTLVYLPYFNMASMIMFEHMQNPKKEIKYNLKK